LCLAEFRDAAGSNAIACLGEFGGGAGMFDQSFGHAAAVVGVLDLQGGEFDLPDKVFGFVGQGGFGGPGFELGLPLAGNVPAARKNREIEDEAAGGERLFEAIIPPGNDTGTSDE